MKITSDEQIRRVVVSVNGTRNGTLSKTAARELADDLVGLNGWQHDKTYFRGKSEVVVEYIKV